MLEIESQDNVTVTELRLSYRYIKEHPWVVTAVNGFLSAYFMEQPSFRVQRHFDELKSGMYAGEWTLHSCILHWRRTRTI